MGKSQKRTSIGGQALIEGIMMRGPRVSSMATRSADGSISTEVWANAPRRWYNKTPLLRGIFNMVESLVVGYRALMKSADAAGIEEEEKPSKFDVWLDKKLGDKATSAAGVFGVVLGLALAILLFTIIPSSVAKLLSGVVSASWLLTLIEGCVKIVVFIGYLFFCTRVKEVRRVFEYHGAEHKTIACYEAGDELTPENARKYRRFHPRCGTSFLLIVLIISIIVSSFISWDVLILRILLKILLIPVIVGVSYELIKLAGRYDNFLTRAVSAPGLWLQRLTTAEPDDGMLEVAIAAMKLVIPENSDEDNW